MSKRKPTHPPKNGGQADPDHQCAKNENTKRHVYIDPSFKVDLVDSLKNGIKTDQGQKATQNQKQFAWTVVSAIAGIFAAFFVGIQGFLLRQSNEINRTAVESVQRAFVYTDTFDAVRLGDPAKNRVDGRVRIVFEWKNGGTTATKNLITHLSAQWFPAEPPDGFQKTDYPAEIQPFRMSIGPHAVVRSKPIIVSADDAVMLSQERGHFYFWGWAKYNDVFPATSGHISRFCYQLLVDGNPMTDKNINLSTVACERGNCADDECSTQ